MVSTVTDTYSYVYNGSQLSQLTVDGTVMNFAYDASGTPLAVDYNGTTYYYATNLQGDVVAILNSSGVAVVEYTYNAWGNILSTSGTMASTLGVHNPLRYRGYVYDPETGLYYLQSRYYNPEMGRFISADALVSTGQGILGNNMFAYCLNNPVNYSDPFGNVGSSNHFYVTIESGKKLFVMYDVPLYSQGAYSLCWAFCQIMVEDYHAGFTSTPKEAEQKAIALAKSVNGEKIYGGRKNGIGVLFHLTVVKDAIQILL